MISIYFLTKNTRRKKKQKQWRKPWSKTRTDSGSGIARPKIDNKDQFELKGQFLKELRENTFSGSDNEDANEHIEKVLEIVDLFHVPNITEVILFYNGLDVLTRQILDSRGRSTKNSDGLAAIQAQMNNLGREIKKVNEKVYVAQVRCEQCKGPHYPKDCLLKEGWKTLEEAYYTQFGGPFQGGGYRATAPGYYQRNNTNPSYQEQRCCHKEPRRIKTLEIQIGQMSKVLQERGFRSLPISTKTNPRDKVKSISTIIKVDSYSIRRIRSSQYAISTGQNIKMLYKSRQMTVPFPSRLDNHYCEEEEGNYRLKFTKSYRASHINNTIPRKEKDLGSFTLPCYIDNICFNNALIDLGASISVMPLLTYLNLGLGELAHTRLTVELADRIVKYLKGIAKNVLVRIGKFTFPVDFIILDMPEDIKVPLIL
ncbi:hypothetical protein Tco_0660577, partial [Tanacetum coccineum]